MAKADRKPKKKAAQALPIPEGLAVAVGEGNLKLTWDAVEGAKKYAVSVDAHYDADGDGTTDEIIEHDFDAAEPSLSVPMSEFDNPVDVDGDGVDDMVLHPTRVQVKVKGLNPGKGGGPQKHPFSEVVDLTF